MKKAWFEPIWKLYNSLYAPRLMPTETWFRELWQWVKVGSRSLWTFGFIIIQSEHFLTPRWFLVLEALCHFPKHGLDFPKTVLFLLCVKYKFFQTCWACKNCFTNSGLLLMEVKFGVLEMKESCFTSFLTFSIKDDISCRKSAKP